MDTYVLDFSIKIKKAIVYYVLKSRDKFIIKKSKPNSKMIESGLKYQIG